MFKKTVFALLIAITCMAQPIKIPQIEFSPKKYICYRSDTSLTIDGKLNEPAWTKSECMDDFSDIRGPLNPVPGLKTHVKMLWDEKYLYISAVIDETDIWATMKNHDSRLYFDNAFEFFIDPDGDTHNYCEIELNAFNTIWDLIMLRPYRDNINLPISGWEPKGLLCSVSIHGTMNDPSDKDSCWIVEAAIPWDALKEITDVAVPPENYDQWRMNFLRVEWKNEVQNGMYQKLINRETNKPYSSDYWVWSPQGVVNMHYPEMWGYVQFSKDTVGGRKSSFIEKKEEAARWFLRQIYYFEKNYFDSCGNYTSDLKKLGLKIPQIPGYSALPNIECTTDMFEASLRPDDNTARISIRNDGLVWVTGTK